MQLFIGQKYKIQRTITFFPLNCVISNDQAPGQPYFQTVLLR